MILIARRRREQRQPNHELRARQRAHAAQDTEYLVYVVHHQALASS